MSNTVLGVDIGGSGMKAAIVDVERCELTTRRKRIPTPQPANPHSMGMVFGALIDHFSWRGQIGCTFPGVIRDRRVVETAANLDSAWIGVDAAKLFRSSEMGPITMINDADAAGIAEMHVGAGRNAAGVVFMLTIGTGLGTAVFNGGELVPNTELGHLEIDGADAEDLASSRAMETENLPMDVWAKRLERYLGYIEDLLSPDLIIIGGGISAEFDAFGPLIETRASVVPAMLRNHAGIVGAAIAATR